MRGPGRPDRGASAGMALKDPRNADSAVEAAVARVLQAEHDARAAIDDARAQAARIAEQARAQARQCAERARQRVARGQAALERRLQADLAAIEAAGRALPEHDEPDAGARARLDAAVHALAAALTGGTTEAR
jgi:hypothetical protein